MVVLTLIIVLISVLLVLIVLLQKSKGGGLAAGFQSSNQVLGAPKTADFLEKTTWTLMGVIAVLCIASTLVIKHNHATVQGSSIEAVEQTAPTLPESVADEAPAEAPAEAPVEAPAQ